MTITRRRVTSAADMKALAHPVRWDLIDLLLVNGPMTASDAAAALDQTPANVSWHLRTLAQHGFVRQATSGPGRRRPWKVVAESLSWGDDAEDTASASALHEVALEREFQRLRAALANIDSEAQQWREATEVCQNRLWLTAEEAQEIGEQIRQLFLTKAQIFELTDKDALDLACLLLDHELAEHDDDCIDVRRIAALTGADWGLWRTVTRSLDHLLTTVDGLALVPGQRATIAARIDALRSELDGAPKTAKWKLRARVGDHVRWYELPEDPDRAA